MAKNRDNIRIYGDDDSGVWTAPKGSTGPSTLAALASPWEEVGWLGDGGIDLERAEESAKFNAWQGGAVVRKKVTSVEDTFKFVCLEETALTLGLYYKGATKTTAASVDKWTVTNQARSDERAWVVDFVDSLARKRYVIPTGEVTGRATVPHKNSDLTMYEYTVTIYGDYEILKTAV